MSNSKLISIFATVFIAVVGWIFQMSYTKLSSIEVELQRIKVELVQIQSQMITEDRVKELIEHELLKHNIK